MSENSHQSGNHIVDDTAGNVDASHDGLAARNGNEGAGEGSDVPAPEDGGPGMFPPWALWVVAAACGLAAVAFGPESWHPYAVFMLGVIALLLGGQWLVEGSISLARHFNVPPLVIGLTVVAIGTSAPELAFNIIAALNHNTELSFGNVVGSNIANIGLALGLAALIRPLVVHSRIIARELPILVVVTFVMIAMAFVPGVAWEGRRMPGYNFWDGLVMSAAFIALLAFWARLAQKDARDPLSREVTSALEVPPFSMPIAITLVVLGTMGLAGGGKLTEVGSVEIAVAWGMSKAMIGLTIVALATSLPEVVTAVIACKRGHTDLAIGNIVGSNLFNIMLVLGVTSMITNVPLLQSFNTWDLMVMGALTLILLPIAVTNQRRVTRWQGLVLLLSYLAYIAYTIVREQ